MFDEEFLLRGEERLQTIIGDSLILWVSRSLLILVASLGSSALLRRSAEIARRDGSNGFLGLCGSPK